MFSDVSLFPCLANKEGKHFYFHDNCPRLHLIGLESLDPGNVCIPSVCTFTISISIDYAETLCLFTLPRINEDKLKIKV